MLTSLPMKSWHVTSIFPPPWLEKIVPTVVESLMENQNCFVGRQYEQVCQGPVSRRRVGRCLQMIGVCVTCTDGTLVGGWGQKGAQQADAKLIELTWLSLYIVKEESSFPWSCLRY
jgi:hypothetical protein